MENAELLESEAPAEDRKPYSVLRALMGVIFLPVVLFGVLFISTEILRNSGDKFDQSVSFALSSGTFLVAAILYLLLTGKAKEILSFLRLRNFSIRYLFYGLGGAVGAYALAIIVAQLVSYLNAIFGSDTPSGQNETSQAIGGLSQSHSIFLIGFLIAILAPICEEIFFRGAMLSSLVQDSQNKWLRAGSILIVTAFFALAHFQSPTGTIADLLAMLVPAMVGLTAAILRLRFDSLYPGIFTHMFYNAFVLVIITAGAS